MSPTSAWSPGELQSPTSRQTRQVGGADNPPQALPVWAMLMLLRRCSSQYLQEPEPALAAKGWFGDGHGTPRRCDPYPLCCWRWLQGAGVGWIQAAAQGNSYPSLVHGIFFHPPFPPLQRAAAGGGSFSAGDRGHGEHLFIDRNTKWSMNLSGCSSSLLSLPKGPSSSSCSALSSHQCQALAGDSNVCWEKCLSCMSHLCKSLAVKYSFPRKYF